VEKMALRRVRNLIIGAGPYGLSIAAHLRAWNADYTIVAQFLDYAQWFQERAVPRIEDEEVVGLDRQGQSFAARLASGDVIEAMNVVIAIGQRDFRVIPSVLNGAPNGCVSHTSDHADLSAFRGRHVTIIGLGQSGLETAALLYEQGAKVCVIGRDSKVNWNKQPPEVRSLWRKIRMPESGLAESWRCLGFCELPQAFRFIDKKRRLRLAVESLGPSGAWWLKDRVHGKFPVHTGSEIVAAGAQENRVELTVRTDDRLSRMTTDHVMAGTGFEVDIARIPFLARSLLPRIKSCFGYPELNGNMEAPLPGLFFAGSASAFGLGPVMRFMFGGKYAAPVIARALTHRAG
jgi:lysine/ornithine N-monooxygenase